MSSAFNDFLPQTIVASTFLCGTCHYLQTIKKIPEIDRMKIITLGIGGVYL